MHTYPLTSNQRRNERDRPYFHVNVLPFYQNYADKVRISSKLVARITRLPYMSDTRRVSYLVRLANNAIITNKLILLIAM